MILCFLHFDVLSASNNTDELLLILSSHYLYASLSSVTGNPESVHPWD